MTAEQPPAPISDSVAHIDSPWFRLWHELVYAPAHTACTLGFSLRLEGRRNMPLTGPVLLIANHQSFLDPPLVGLCARRPLVYVARKSLFRNRFFAFIIRGMNAVPIDQEGLGKEGIRITLDQLKHGRPILLFPEGSRTPDGTMQPLRPGIHLLIKRVQAPIVPVGIAGAYQAWPIWRKYPLPAPLFWPADQSSGTIAVVLGKPVDSRRYAELPREQAMQELFELIAKEQARAEKLRRVGKQ
jgi:1-acyl-sn-glycerol-3-phosphate acyltransferase